MIISLHPTTLMIENLDKIDASERTKQLQSITSACIHNFVESLNTYRTIQNTDTARQAVRLYHTELLRLYQELDRFYKNRKIDDRSALSALEDLLERIEFLFKNDIDPNTALPSHYRHKLSTYIEGQMHSIFDRLAKKQIPQVYLDEILSALNSLFEEGKIPYVQYRHQDYLKQFVGALRQLANDDRNNKNWEYRFFVLMVNFNFNHMGFFNRWKEMYLEDPSFNDGLLRFPKHFSCIKGFAYDNNRTSLLKLMCEFIQDETNKAQSSSTEKTAQFIHSNLNGTELMLWMHLCYKAKVTKALEKKEVAFEFSKLVKTRDGTLLSLHSLTKMDKNAEYDAAVIIQRILKDMLKELNDRYPGLNR